MTFAVILAIVFSIAVVGTGLVRRYAITHRLLDVPNLRSSHQAPKPRGGGIAIVGAASVGLALGFAAGEINGRVALAVLAGGLMVATIGFVDDHRSVPPGGRLVVHFTAAAMALACLGGLSPVVFGLRPDLSWVSNTLALIGTVWLLNLYNFMDGIDGIASVEAAAVGISASIIYAVSQAPADATRAPLLLAAAALGFLVWNFPPAKIFMGDAGSGFIGFVLAVLAIQSAHVAPLMVWSWTILLGVFVVDATLTLFVRMARRERLHEAHRSHAYQHAARSFGGHGRVTVAVGAIGLCWLLPIALLLATHRLHPALAVLIAYAPLVPSGVALRAGRA